METLYRYLTEPRIVGDKVIQPTAMMMRAGKALAQLSQTSNRDRELANEKQSEAMKAHDEYIKLRLHVENLERTIAGLNAQITGLIQTITRMEEMSNFEEYNEAMNADRD